MVWKTGAIFALMMLSQNLKGDLRDISLVRNDVGTQDGVSQVILEFVFTEGLEFSLG